MDWGQEYVDEDITPDNYNYDRVHIDSSVYLQRMDSNNRKEG